jgi:hypothetical protein
MAGAFLVCIRIFRRRSLYEFEHDDDVQTFRSISGDLAAFKRD